MYLSRISINVPLRSGRCVFNRFSIFLLKIKKKFIDNIRIFVKGGCGGMGSPKFKGIGGNGGSVYVEAKKGATLKNIYHKFSKRLVTAESGENSRPMKIFGEPGKDKVLDVPCGVTIYDEFMRKIGELNQVGERLKVAEGAPGGSPNSRPPYSGSKGHSQVITIDLKLIADVGLLGFPNAGKSTLLKAVSRASPEIASYAFTTLRPNLGTIAYPDHRLIKVADLPGLIEGASRNLGMGHRFLKHVERSSLLLMVVDINGFQLSPMSQHRSCLETIIILNKELELYNKELLNKPAVLAINKMDLPGSVSNFREISPHLNDLSEYVSRVPEEIRPEKLITFDSVVPISAMYDSDSVEKLKILLRESIDKHVENSLKDTMTKHEMELLKKIKFEKLELNKVEI